MYVQSLISHLPDKYTKVITNKININITITTRTIQRCYKYLLRHNISPTDVLFFKEVKLTSTSVDKVSSLFVSLSRFILSLIFISYRENRRNWLGQLKLNLSCLLIVFVLVCLKFEEVKVIRLCAHLLMLLFYTKVYVPFNL